MKYVFLVAMSLLLMDSAFAQDDYYRRKAESYTREAEGYQREAAYYTKIGKLDNAKTYTRYAESAMDKYKTQVKYASQADEKAAQYLRWAADALSKH